MRSRPAVIVVTAATVAALAGCGSDPAPAASVAQPLTGSIAAGDAAAPSGSGTITATVPAATPSPTATAKASPSTPAKKPAPTPSPTRSAAPVAVAPASFGNPAGKAAVPAAARAVDTRRATTVIGKGTAASCTSAAVVRAVARGGIIRFNCGAKPVTITMTSTAKVVNTSARVVLDGGGKVTLSGAGKRRIFYMNTCDPAQKFTTPHCQDQATPNLTLQNITFANGNSSGQTAEGGGGGAVFVRGGRVKVVNTRFVGNRCDSVGPDVGGAGLRVLSQYSVLPVYVFRSKI